MPPTRIGSAPARMRLGDRGARLGRPARGEQASAPSTWPNRRCGTRASSSARRAGGEDAQVGIDLRASALITVPPCVSASASASADLPLAVGPAMSATGLAVGGVAMFIATLIAAGRSPRAIFPRRCDRLAAAGCAPAAPALDRRGRRRRPRVRTATRQRRARRWRARSRGVDVVVQPAERPRARSCSSPTWIRR